MKTKVMLKSIMIVLLIAVLMIPMVSCTFRDTNAQEIKNIIIMIPDGMGMEGLALARWAASYDIVSGRIDPGVSLALDGLASGLVRTHWTDGVIIGGITDSAPAANTYATGVKTNDNFVGVTYNSVPAATILEAAQLIGKSTGLIATSNIQHATPANFSSHTVNRRFYDVIAEQQVYNGIDVVFGGGSLFLEPEYRNDDEELVDIILGLGYRYITTRDEMTAVTNAPVWGMFAPFALAYDIDREYLAPEEPTLAEMTAKAIELLSQNDDGFFLIVEGSKIDWAAHANDPVALVSDILAFDAAVSVALEFAEKSQNTMLLIMSDHGTGGISIGNAETNRSYSEVAVNIFVEPLARAKLTGEGIGQMLYEDRSNLFEVLQTYFGITDLTDEEIERITETPPDLLGAAVGMNGTVGPMISKRAGIGWTTTGHTGGDVVLFTYLPGDERITGVIDNTDIAKICADAWNIDLESISRDFFNNATAAFDAMGAAIEITEKVMTVNHNGNVLVIYANKNYVFINDEKITLPSITVQIEDIFYIHVNVLELLNN